MFKTLRSRAVLSGSALLITLSSAHATVSMIFTNGGSSPNSANVSPGGTFNFSVKLNETAATDQVSGVDYQLHASSNGVLEFLSRNSNVSGSSFTFDNGSSDSALSAVTLNPNNGTDLGTSTASGAGVSGPGTYEISDFSFEVLPSTPRGIYTLSFTQAQASGAPPAYPVLNIASLGTYTIFVPGPVIPGDANYDGKVDGSDYSIIDNSYASENFVNGVPTTRIAGWTNGDFNLDGVVDGTDYTLIDNSFNTQTGSSMATVSTQIASVVPEPTTFSIIVFSSMGLFRYREDRKRA